LIVTIHQPEHLPWLGFFDKIAAADIYVCLDTVQFRKNYFQNRNRILTRSGPVWVTVPIKVKGHLSGRIADLEIAEDGRWAKKYWRTVTQSYGRHPFFDEYGPAFGQIISRSWPGLRDLNLALIALFLEALGLERTMILASDLGVTGQSTALLLDICRKLGADVYLSGPMGENYLDESEFEAAGIAVRYHRFDHPVYPQLGRDEFVDKLSAFDLLMNHGPEGRFYLPSLST
jgi:hypothetical protein